MKKLTLTILTILFCLNSNVGWTADYQKGLTAARSGDFATAFRVWTPLAKQGHAAAQRNLGLMYYSGQGVPKDYKTAAKWYRLAAKQGHVIAQLSLGLMYHSGQGVPKDYKTAAKWYRLAADQGNANSQRNLGLMYRDGYGVPKDHKTAVKWYRLAAKQGHATAQRDLGVMYRDGDGVPKDHKTAVKWYRLAAKQGHAAAQGDLGLMYERGQGVPQDYKTAVKWLGLAAKQGNAGAQFNLGVMYDNGRGVPQDYKTAVVWLKLAAKQGHVSAQKRLSILQKKLKSNQKTAIKKQLKSKSYLPCEQHKMFKDPKVWAGMLKVATTIAKNKNFRFSFPLSTTLHCNFKGKPGRQTLSFTPEPRHPKINRQYVDVSLGIGKSCAIFMAADTSIKNQAALNVIYNFKTKKYKNNPGYPGWNKFCS